MLKVNQEEKERILKLHSIEEQAGVPTASNQSNQSSGNAQNNRTLEFINVQRKLAAAFHNPGTNVKKALEAFQRANPAKFDDIIRELMKQTTKIDTYNGLTAALNGEYGFQNRKDLENINKVFTDNNSKFKLDWKIGTDDDDVKSIRLILNKNYKAPQTQPQTQTQAQTPATAPNPTQPQRQVPTVNRSAQTDVQNKTKEIQRALGMKETGTMDEPTINKAYEIISKL